MFQKALLFWNAIILCYNKQIVMKVVGQVPPPFTWHICWIIVDFLSLIVSTCVLNQLHGHLLLSDALNYAISMILKLRVGFNVLLSLQNLMEEESIIVDELTYFAYNIRKEICVVLKSFLSFFKNLKKIKLLICFFDVRFWL